MLGERAIAPDMIGYDADGAAVRLSQAKKPAVVYFYPKDGTPGCTKEACAFRDAWEKYTRAGVSVFGVSADSKESHDAFRKEHKLPFPLVPDESGAAAKAYGVSTTLGLDDRVTFLVDKDSYIARVWHNVDPALHATEVLDAASKLPR